jgi:hypothetical protein
MNYSPSVFQLAFFGQVLLWLVVLGLFLASRQASIFHPLGMYLAFHGLVFILRPIFVHCFGFHSTWDYMGFEPDPNQFVRTLVVSSVGLAALATTCLVVGRADPVFPKGPAPVLTPEQSAAVTIITVILLPLMAYSIHAAAGDTGGQSAANGIYILTKTTGYLTDAQFMMAPLLCLWLLKTRFHWLNLVPILAYIAYRVWCGWARWTFLLFFVTLVLQYCWYHRLRWLQAWILAAALPMLALFNILGHNRGVLQTYLKEGTITLNTSDLAAGMSAEEKHRQQLDTQDFANFDYLAAVVAVVPDRSGAFTYGTQYLQLFTEPIPRILWRGKPVGAPISFFGMNQFVNFTGLTISLVGDGWISGGWIGMILTMALAGVVLGLAHRSFWANSRRPMPSMLYLTFLSVSPNWFRDGGISVFKFLMFTWLPFLMVPVVVWILSGRFVRGGSVDLRQGGRLRLVRITREGGAAASPKAGSVERAPFR